MIFTTLRISMLRADFRFLYGSCGRLSGVMIVCGSFLKSFIQMAIPLKRFGEKWLRIPITVGTIPEQ
jgi:hypothetical protein